MASTLSAQSTSVAPTHAPDWKLDGEGFVCCPCRVPCPCRSNSRASYGHCEATLYLRIKQGHYQDVDLDGLQIVESGGMCAIEYRSISVLYVDALERGDRREAYIKLKSTLAPAPVQFAHVENVSLHTQVTDGHLYHVSIPDILEILVDRNWGLSVPPMPIVAAPDVFANELQYVQNIRYRIHDDAAGLNFDYIGRQANYRVIHLTPERYQTKSMLIQFSDYTGWFSPQQLALIKDQHLQIPALDSIRDIATRLRNAGGGH